MKQMHPHDKYELIVKWTKLSLEEEVDKLYLLIATFAFQQSIVYRISIGYK